MSPQRDGNEFVWITIPAFCFVFFLWFRNIVCICWWIVRVRVKNFSSPLLVNYVFMFHGSEIVSVPSWWLIKPQSAIVRHQEGSDVMWRIWWYRPKIPRSLIRSHSRHSKLLNWKVIGKWIILIELRRFFLIIRATKTMPITQPATVDSIVRQND